MKKTRETLLYALLLALLGAAAPFLCLLLPAGQPTAATLPSPTPVVAGNFENTTPLQPLPTLAPQTAGSTPAPTPAAGEAVTVYDAAAGAEAAVPVVDFLVGAAACEMPPTWPDAALQAQMVASHSYALALGEPMQVNSALCAGWTDADALKARWGDAFEGWYAHLQTLARQVAGAVLCYQGQPAAACYHGMSNGKTQASQNVWLTALPYLQGVDSPWDANAEGCEVTVTYTLPQVEDVLQGLGLDTTGDPAAWFGAPQWDAAGYVATQPVCGADLAGTTLRGAFALRSACFTVAYDADAEEFYFTTHGYGHCVGLSQQGAKAMAEGAAGWQDILTYYFPGCEVVG